MSFARAAAAPPLRFLLIVLTTWIALRVVMLAPWRSVPAVEPARASPVAPSSRSFRGVGVAVARIAPLAPPPEGVSIARQSATNPARVPLSEAPSDRGYIVPTWPILPSVAVMAPSIGMATVERVVIPPALATPSRNRRWSASAWLFVRRDGGGPALAPGGTLGGGQAGGRLLYRLNRDARRPLSLSGRVYTPLRRTAGAEASLGFDWRPVAAFPVHLLAERRQALGPDGRSAFALTLYGGHTARLPRGAELDLYGQAGIVGVESRDLFADGAARVRVPVGPIDVGGGVWGAAQPGAARVDAGPHVSVRLPVRTVNLRLSADWRFRLAGDAAPGSGPALTLGADF